jgi:hypothetical protein
MTKPFLHQPVIFVGGAPRSGTTVTHALLCTSSRTNRYHPEISYIRPLVNSFVVGTQNYEGHTSSFFAKPEEFANHCRSLIGQAMNRLAWVLGSPEVLTVKDPLLTTLFPWLRRLFGDRVRFVTVVRNPYNVVRSRQEVMERAGQTFTEAAAAETAREYVASYAHIDLPQMQSSTHVLRYEDLMDPATLEALRAFTGFADLSPHDVWGERRGETGGAAVKDPWFSPKYMAPINTESRLSPLEPRFMQVVDRICGPLMDRYGYTRQGG